LKTQLVCTFVKRYEIDEKLNDIRNEFTVLSGKVFLMKSTELINELILSYNVLLDSHKDFLPGSILVHRKKETNTIYTINALNELIMNLNNGVLDKSYRIDWEIYRDKMLIKKPEGLKIIKTDVSRVYVV
jgi:hypothetical protein